MSVIGSPTREALDAGTCLRRLHEDYRGDIVRSEIDGHLTRGGLFVDDDGLVHWLTDEQTTAMKGLDRYSGATGHDVLEVTATPT